MAEIRDQSGRVFATCMIPDGWSVKAERQEHYQSIDKPFNLSVLFTSPDGGDVILARTGEKFLDILQSFNRMVDSFQEGELSKLLPMTMLRQKTPEEILDVTARATYSGAQLAPQAIASLPSVYGNHPEYLERLLQAKFNYQCGWDHSFVNPVAEPVLTGLEHESLLKRYTFNGDGVFLLGADINALHYENRSTQNGLANGLTGLFFSSATGIYTVWGNELIFALVTTESRESTATDAFLQVVQTFMLDPSVQEEIFRLAGQWNQSVFAKQQQYNAVAQNLQRQNMINQQRLTQTLASNASEMNAMIMDSWEKRSASMDHMNSMQQEATMGVNTFIRTDGSTVQHSVASEHVYENKYGDTVGVSGNSEAFRTSLNWTELKKKQ